MKPHASYTLTSSEQVSFYNFLKIVKFLDEFVSNISRCVNDKNSKISGLKTYDYHVLLHRLLLIDIRAYLPKNVYNIITELCSFFCDFHMMTIRVSDLDRLQAYIIIILCKLEGIFPPTLFSVIVHLAVHLLYEAKSLVWLVIVRCIPLREAYACWSNMSKIKHVLKGLLSKHMS